MNQVLSASDTLENAIADATRDLQSARGKERDSDTQTKLDENLKILEQAKKDLENQQINDASQKLDSVRGQLESLPGAKTNPEIQAAIRSLSGVVANDSQSAQQALALANAAQQTAQAEAGAVIQQTGMGLALGAAAIAGGMSTVAGLLDAKTLAGFKTMVSDDSGLSVLRNVDDFAIQAVNKAREKLLSLGI